jgi:hypothetical protein
MNIKYGGELKSGDFIAVARQGYLELGWFEKQGTNTIHYFLLNNVKWTLNHCKDEDNNNAKEHYRCMKSHASDNHNRAVKIFYPEEILGADDLEDYKTGTELLKKFKFIK